MSDDILERLFSEEILDGLRSYTIRSKIRRLNLPPPGTLVKVRTFVALTTVTTEHGGGKVVFQYKDALLLVMFVDTLPRTQWHYQQKNVIDPVEITFMTQSGTLASTGARAGADIMAPYEVLCC